MWEAIAQVQLQHYLTVQVSFHAVKVSNSVLPAFASCLQSLMLSPFLVLCS